MLPPASPPAPSGRPIGAEDWLPRGKHDAPKAAAPKAPPPVCPDDEASAQASAEATAAARRPMPSGATAA
eukprot:2971161-Alexandrium_andersonii.AAC.1